MIKVVIHMLEVQMQKGEDDSLWCVLTVLLQELVLTTIWERNNVTQKTEKKALHRWQNFWLDKGSNENILKNYIVSNNIRFG